MKVAQLAFSLSNRAGGIFEIQVGLSHALTKLGVDVAALGLEDDLTLRDASRWGGISAKCLLVSGSRFFGYAKDFHRTLDEIQPDLCHLQTLWMYPGIAMKNWSRKQSRPYVVTPNGMLEPWALANSGWKKRLAGFFYENSMLRGAACLQANTQKEANDFRAYGLKNRIEIVPNGVDLPEFLTTEDKKKTEDKKRLLFLGRIHPKKGLIGALRAWAKLRNSPSAIRDSAEWQFVIAGWDQGGHEAELRALCADLGLKTAVGTTKDTNIHENIEPRITRMGTDDTEAQGGACASQAGAAFSNPSTSQLARDCENTSPTRSPNGPASSPATSYSLPATAPKALALDARPSSLVSSAAADVLFYGPAFGEEKEALLRGAEAFILPSFSEGLPMSVLEAWAYGLPVVMTPECNLPEGFARQSALKIRNRELATSHSLLATPTKLESDWEGLRALLEMSEAERGNMGMRGRRLVEERFTWSKVAASMKEIYESLL
jgi:glycosyltransferase involved in cell wall biosynthesis